MMRNIIQDEILLELWQNAFFDDSALSALETIARSQSKKKDKLQLIIPKEAFFVLSTTRNRNLITYTQQLKLRKTVVGFFGLSVGSHSAVTWMMISRADAIKIIDPDKISPTNLNRLRVGWDQIGKLKINVVEEELKKINPDLAITSTNKTDIASMKQLFLKNPKINIIVDSIDEMDGKVFLRKMAREHKIPLVSAADVGDMVVLDIERYDQIPQPELFLGRIPNIENIDFSTLSDLEKKKIIVKLVGLEKNNEELLDSLLQIGSSLATWPQLGSTATLAGGIIATTIKKIILQEAIQSGRYYFSVDDVLVQDFNASDRKERRAEKTKKVREKFNV